MWTSVKAESYQVFPFLFFFMHHCGKLDDLKVIFLQAQVQAFCLEALAHKVFWCEIQRFFSCLQKLKNGWGTLKETWRGITDFCIRLLIFFKKPTADLRVTFSIFTLFKNHPKCLTWIFQFWHFPPIFCPIKIDLSGNTVWPQSSGFQTTRQNGPFLASLN